MKVIGVIPSRYASTRLPGKPLIDLNGKSMIRRVWEGAREATSLSRLVVATDDERVAEECSSFGAEVVLTPSSLASGTDRIAYACELLQEQFDVIVNIQGDEPLLRGTVIDRLVAALSAGNMDVATPVQRIGTYEELVNPAVVKVVMNTKGRALYFSRSPVPFLRDIPNREMWSNHHTFWKHIGLYAYTQAALKRFISLPPSPLEQLEALEQLRLLEDGASFQCIEIDDILLAVDTPEDAARVRAVISTM